MQSQMKLGAYYSIQTGQSNNGCISAHVGSTSPLPPEMDSSGYFMELNSGGYFMELNRTFGNTQQLCNF